MLKILLICVIAASAAQQATSGGQRLKVNDGVSRADGQRRPASHEHVGGFQNGNFAYTDGILKTNLNSGQTAEQSFRPREDTYVQEGAAFRRPAGGAFDVHSSRGRGDGSSQLTESGGNGPSYEHDQRNQNAYSQTNNGHRGQQDNNSDNRNYETVENTNIRNDETVKGGEQSNIDQYSVRNDQTTNENANSEINQNRQSDRGQNTQQTIRQDGRSSETSQRSINVNSKADKEAMERELSNQIANMYFKESTEPREESKDNEVRRGPKGEGERWVWTDGGEGQSTSGGGGQSTSGGDGQSTTPGVDDRAAFTADQCPTGKAKFNNVCVDVD